MRERVKYAKRRDQTVVAVQLELDTEGFEYKKWGGVQRCKAGDWIVNSDNDVYTVDRESFARSYRRVGPGTYLKVTPVWAAIADVSGEVRTKEGTTHIEPGDYVVFNDETEDDGYAMPADKFEAMYERQP